MLGIVRQLRSRMSLSSGPVPREGDSAESPGRTRSPRSLRWVVSAQSQSERSELRLPSPPTPPLRNDANLIGVDLLLCVQCPVCLINRQGHTLESNNAVKRLLNALPATSFLDILPLQEQMRARSFLTGSEASGEARFFSSQHERTGHRLVEWTVTATPRPGLFVVTGRYSLSR